MRQYLTALAAFLVLIGGMIPAGHAQEKRAQTPHIEMLDDAFMDKMVTLAEPTEQHKMLASLAGTWLYTLQFWTDEGAEAQTSSGTMTNEMTLGERFLSGKTALILNIGGQTIPYEGSGILGYDTVHKTFTSSWADSMRTGIMNGTGQYNEQTKTIEEKGRFTHPLLEKEQPYRAELQFVDEETYRRSLFMTGKSGNEFKVLEIEFKKKKD